MGLQFGTQRIDRVLNQLPRAKLGDGAKFSNDRDREENNKRKSHKISRVRTITSIDDGGAMAWMAAVFIFI